MTDSKKTGLVYDSIFEEHETGPDQPESPARYRAIMNAIEVAGIAKAAKRIRIRTAKIDELRLVHTPEYVDTVKFDVMANRGWLSTGDTAVGARSFEIALFAVGGVLSATDAVMSGQVRNAFCLVRPPGHHASRDCGKGFCIFNNVAIAARYLQKKHGIKKILIVDWDTHHGNGTQDIFYDDPTVMYFSAHQWPWYPGTGAAEERGAGAGANTTVNVPLSKSATVDAVLDAFDTKLIPAADTFKPEFILISAGFDMLRGDPLGMMKLEPEDFAEITRRVLKVAERHSGGRIVSVLEGGYDPARTAAAVVAHLAALCEA